MPDRTKDISIKILSDRKYKLKEATFQYQLQNEQWVEKKREFFDHGDATTILLYNTDKKTVILNRQFRFPTLINGNEEEGGFMFETPAGKIEESDASPEECMMREVLEETGYKISEPKRIMKAYSTPAAVTEKIYYFITEYTDDMKVTEGGGAKDENEDIEVHEIPFQEAFEMISNGNIKDAKTIVLLQYAKLEAIFQ